MPLTVVGGLPAVGKTTVCREALRLRAEARSRSRLPAWLRINSTEQALRDSGEVLPGMPAGVGYYVVAAVTRDVLDSGGDVLVECVNPLPLACRLWEETASDLGVRFLAVELICSGEAKHRCRAQQRVSDIKGLELPGWQEIARRDYAPWPEADLRLDTARLTVTEAVRAIVDPGPVDGTRWRWTGEWTLHLPLEPTTTLPHASEPPPAPANYAA